MNKELRYSIIRSQRKTIAITVSGGEITVRAPYGVSEDRIEKLLTDKRKWIEEKLSIYDQSVLRFAAVRNYFAVLDAGKEIAALFGGARNAETDGKFYFKNPRSVRTYFIRTRGWILTEALYCRGQKIGLLPDNVIICDSKAKWGSCDAKRVIKLNWRLTMLPAELRDYVILHELCHLKEMNHSSAFWGEVARCCPDYKHLRRELKEYSFLTLLYRK